MSEDQITSDITYYVQDDPAGSGYADSMGNNASQNAQADLDVLFTGIDVNAFSITRLFAQLPATALDADLMLGASADQSAISNSILATKYINAPPCPCEGGGGGSGGSGGSVGSGGSGGSGSHGGCDVGGGQGAPALGALLTALALAAMRRRRG